MDEAAEALGVRRTTVTKLVYGGDLPSFKIGSRRLVAEADLVRFVERRAAGDDHADVGRENAAASGKAAAMGRAGGGAPTPSPA